MNFERMMLEDVQFDTCFNHPYRFVIVFAKALNGNALFNVLFFYSFDKGQKHVAEKAWKIVDDSYTTTLCIQYPPHTIALAALYIAYRIDYLQNAANSDRHSSSEGLPIAFGKYEWFEKYHTRLTDVQGEYIYG